MFPGAISSRRGQKIDSTPKPSVPPLARRGASQPMWTTQRFNRGVGGAWLSLARRFSARCKPSVTDALLSAIYRRGVWKGTNASRTKIRFFFGVRNWMCGVRACETMQKRVSHGKTVRVGSSVFCQRVPELKFSLDVSELSYSKEFQLLTQQLVPHKFTCIHINYRMTGWKYPIPINVTLIKCNGTLVIHWIQ